MIPAVTTGQIYKGSIAFILLQVLMVAVVISYPSLVTSSITETVRVDADKALEQLFQEQPGGGVPGAMPDPLLNMPSTAPGGAGSDPLAPASPAGTIQPPTDDPMKALLESVKKDAEKK
jgi:hypothetical protein